jgi:hypothetical protein
MPKSSNKKYYINYADAKFSKQQKFSLNMAKKNGRFNSVKGYFYNDIDRKFYSSNKKILDMPRGAGYWLWKPYFIKKKLSEINNGDYLFYSDSGAFFLSSVDILIEELEKHNQDIMCFELSSIESQYTKKELFLKMGCDDEYYKTSNQIMSTFHLIRKTSFSIKFYNNFLKYCCDEVNLTDKHDKSVKQSDDFIEHRHDQSILSLLYKKNNLRPFKDPTQFGEKCLKRIPIPAKKKDVIYGRVYTLKNGVKRRCYDYVEAYQNILFINRGKNPVLAFLEYKIPIFGNGVSKIYGIFRIIRNIFNRDIINK